MEENKEGMNVILNSDIQVIEDDTANNIVEAPKVEEVIVQETTPVIEQAPVPEAPAPEIPAEERSKIDEISDILGLNNKASIYVVAVIGIIALILIIVCLLFAIG